MTSPSANAPSGKERIAALNTLLRHKPRFIATVVKCTCGGKWPCSTERRAAAVALAREEAVDAR